jgi:hypothetical protein
MQIPRCANNLEGHCPKSDTYVSRETDTTFAIVCKTCKGINIFPKDNADGRGKYDAFLKKEMELRQAREAHDRRTIYST